MRKKVAVGMSGGVDSSVAAALLQEQGYEVTGVFIEAYNEPGCRTDEDKRDALKVATKLGIRFQTLDVRKEYKEKVVRYFYDEYEAGRTPNPDVVCNREVKFGLFYDYARKEGFDYVATGHYARIRNQLYLQRPKDLSKDQTYWLWQVESQKLKYILFPLGELTKKEVRAKAKELGLPNAGKPDSMGVCMMGELNVAQFLCEKLGENPGEVVWRGKVVGTHKGLWFATIGQRGGWAILPARQTATMPSLYVIGKNKEQNQLVVGGRGECMRKEIALATYDLRMGEEEIQVQVKNERLWARIRNLGELVKVAQLSRGKILLKDTVFAPAEGQSAVLYLREKEGEEWVAGGGVIGSCN